MRGRPAGMHDPFGNALVVEMEDLFTQDEVFKQRRTAFTGFEAVLIVRNPNALIGRQVLRAIMRTAFGNVLVRLATDAA